jgi:hypothetical protein
MQICKVITVEYSCNLVATLKCRTKISFAPRRWVGYPTYIMKRLTNQALFLCSESKIITDGWNI